MNQMGNNCVVAVTFHILFQWNAKVLEKILPRKMPPEKLHHRKLTPMILFL